jgi:hypothetical protein
MPKTRIMYIEDKSASLNGPARIGRVMFSGESISYGGRTFQSLKDSGFKANYSTLTPEKDFGFRSAPIEIDPDIAEEYWRGIRGKRSE